MWKGKGTMGARLERTANTKSALALVAIVFLATGFAWAATDAPPQGNDAKAILKAMSDYLGSQKTIELTFGYKSTVNDSAPADLQMDGFMISLVSGWHPIIEGARRLKGE